MSKGASQFPDYSSSQDYSTFSDGSSSPDFLSDSIPFFWRVGRHLVGVVLVAWALFVTWLFLASPSDGLANLPSGLRPAGHGMPLASVYFWLFSPNSWNWMVGSETWLDIARGGIGIAAILAIGWLFLSCFRVFFPLWVRVALWFVLGLGICCVVYTFVALAGLLYQWLAIAIYLVLFVSLAIASRRIRKKREVAHYTEGVSREMMLSAQVSHALDAEYHGVIRPGGWFERWLAGAMVLCIGIITFLTFFHALFFPETYWDSLILYLGYARGIFLEHRFPIKVVGQVGVGLGANYPHLFELTGALIATWFNHWSPLYLQLASPLAGLFTIMLIYYMALRMTRSVLIALATALLVRCVPYLITYHIFASNYSFAILFAAAFFVCAQKYINDGLPAYLILAALCAAFSVHINYLMWAMWISWGVLVVAAHGFRKAVDETVDPYSGLASSIHPESAPEFTRLPDWLSGPEGERYSLRWVMRSGAFRISLVAGGLISAIWYLRNWIVTGNPVYAFFTGVFRASKHVNPEVMQSAVKEWQAHGDGIGLADGLARNGHVLAARLGYSWNFFATNQSTVWKWAPIFVGIVVPGVVVFLIILVRQILFRSRVSFGGEVGQEKRDRHCGERHSAEPVPFFPRVIDDSTRFALVGFSLVTILFTYHYLLGPFYLYHLLGCWAAFGIFIALAMQHASRPFQKILCAWAILCAIVPGIPMAMMGSKLTGRPAMELTALHNPGLDAQTFYHFRYGDETAMWEKINSIAKGTAILTHENRQLLFDPSIKLVHMDDWEVQQVWGKSKSERLAALKALGVKYYLQIPYEFDHPVNARLGQKEWIADGTLVKVYQAGEDVLYRFRW